LLQIANKLGLSKKEKKKDHSTPTIMKSDGRCQNVTEPTDGRIL
jgi:hypothetical protein